MSVQVEEVELMLIVKVKTEDFILYMDGTKELFREARQVHSAVVKPAMTPESQRLDKERKRLENISDVNKILARHKSKDDEMSETEL